jgi:hypothetical protein
VIVLRSQYRKITAEVLAPPILLQARLAAQLTMTQLYLHHHDDGAPTSILQFACLLPSLTAESPSTAFSRPSSRALSVSISPSFCSSADCCCKRAARC